MKFRNVAVVLCIGLTGNFVFAQTGTPGTPPTPPVPATAPAVPEPAALSQPKVAEGSLFKSQRQKNDKGTFDFICTYRVAGTKRDVMLEESCPESMVFHLKK